MSACRSGSEQSVASIGSISSKQQQQQEKKIGCSFHTALLWCKSKHSAARQAQPPSAPGSALWPCGPPCALSAVAHYFWVLSLLVTLRIEHHTIPHHQTTYHTFFTNTRASTARQKDSDAALGPQCSSASWDHA